MDFIFVIGPSAVGKTTLAKELYQHYKGVYIEQNMVPEFIIPKKVKDIGLYEEKLCWENTLAQIKFFYEKGLRNIVALDFDDIRAREVPKIFRGYKFIIIRLVSSDPKQIKKQMEHRKNNEGGLFRPEYVERSNSVIRNRNLLPNEVMVDVAGKSKDKVLKEVIKIIDTFKPLKKYAYKLDNKKHYLSWVQSRNLV
jgi:broad-specificity NMP kinase